MACAEDGSAVSVKAIYQWADDANEEWTHYVSEMQLDTDPQRHHKGTFVWRLLFQGLTCFLVSMRNLDLQKLQIRCFCDFHWLFGVSFTMLFWLAGRLKGFFGYYKGKAAGKGKFQTGPSDRDAPYKCRGPDRDRGHGPGADPGSGGCGRLTPVS